MERGLSLFWKREKDKSFLKQKGAQGWSLGGNPVPTSGAWTHFCKKYFFRGGRRGGRRELNESGSDE